HTRSKRDWSSDVCSSDLLVVARARPQGADETYQGLIAGAFKYAGQHSLFGIQKTRWVLRIQGLLNLLKLFFQLFNAHALGKSLQDRKSVVYGKSMELQVV